jgi:hypothetical protein
MFAGKDRITTQYSSLGHTRDEIREGQWNGSVSIKMENVGSSLSLLKVSDSRPEITLLPARTPCDKQTSIGRKYRLYMESSKRRLTDSEGKFCSLFYA